jgi:hypothetical protein
LFYATASGRHLHNIWTGSWNTRRERACMPPNAGNETIQRHQAAMKPPKKPFIVEIKQARLSGQSCHAQFGRPSI